jgi:hypothetical protein
LNQQNAKKAPTNKGNTLFNESGVVMNLNELSCRCPALTDY